MGLKRFYLEGARGDCSASTGGVGGGWGDDYIPHRSLTSVVSTKPAVAEGGRAF